MRQICECCGAEREEHWMMNYNTGRKTHWFCWECWKSGQGEAASIEIERKRKKRWENMKKK